MSINQPNIFPSQIMSPEIKINFLPDFNLIHQIKLESPFILNFSSKSSDEEEDPNFFNPNDYLDFIPSIPDENNKPSLDEFVHFKSMENNYRNNSLDSFKNYNLFTNTEKKFIFT